MRSRGSSEKVIALFFKFVQGFHPRTQSGAGLQARLGTGSPNPLSRPGLEILDERFVEKLGYSVKMSYKLGKQFGELAGQMQTGKGFGVRRSSVWMFSLKKRC